MDKTITKEQTSEYITVKTYLAAELFSELPESAKLEIIRLIDALLSDG